MLPQTIYFIYNGDYSMEMLRISSRSYRRADIFGYKAGVNCSQAIILRKETCSMNTYCINAFSNCRRAVRKECRQAKK